MWFGIFAAAGSAGGGISRGFLRTRNEPHDLQLGADEHDFAWGTLRYVDTFEEEKEIDLAAVAAELRQCDRDMEETDRLIRGFCEELGIDAPL